MPAVLPRLTELEPVHRDYQAFTDALQTSGFRGDIKTDFATRLVTATDNSVYQLLPQAVVYPRGADDVARTLALLAEPRFHHLSMAPRGGGTGTNGQSLNTGVIVDVSRHMRSVGTIDLEGGWVEVEPGVVLDDLNRALSPHGVFFAPNLSPSSRATLGGMISTDACGKGSRVYGKTSEHVLELDLVLADGTTFTSTPLTDRNALDTLKQRDDRVGLIHRTVDDVVTEHAKLIAQRFPDLRRFLTGYNLARITPPAGPDAFNLNYLITGSEGTLAVVTKARLRLTPIPTHSALFVLSYDTFEDALNSAQVLVETDPTAIETIDETVLKLARNDVIWHDVAPLLQGEPAAVNLVEYSGPDAARVAADADTMRASGLTFYEAQNPAEARALWSLRAKGVGLLGATPGRRKPVAFVEDTVVPPQHLPAYVAEFRAILDAEGVTYGMFGHIDVGCLHVRPALDLTDQADEARLRRISDAVAALTRRYGGLMWGEHGKGFRSEYVPEVFGPTLYAAMRRIKGAFDPCNQLNPGKIAAPLDPAGPNDDVSKPRFQLVSVDGPKRGALDRTIPEATRDAFAPAVACNGNGACFNTDVDHVMCPSSKITRDRIHSPKGRAGVMREWLRQTSLVSYDPTAAPTRDDNAFVRALKSPWTFAVRSWHGLQRRIGVYDYNHEVADAMEGCLACKACATQCPVKVDVPAFRSRFLAHYYQRYPRRLGDAAVASLEGLIPTLAKAPRLFNRLIFGNRLSQWLTAKTLGLVDSPLLSEQSFSAFCKAQQVPMATAESLADKDPRTTAIIVPDVFTAFYESHVAIACTKVLQACGVEVFTTPFFANGKGMHVKGYMRRFERLIHRNAANLGRLQASGVPLVGIEPAVTLTYRDEYREVAPDAGPLEVALIQEYLDTLLGDPNVEVPPLTPGPTQYQLMAHCTERTAEPTTAARYARLFERFGLTLETQSTGCCGMCGAYGHDARHREESEGIFEMSWARVIDAQDAPQDVLLADGHSCRSQVKRFRGVHLKHPLEILAERLQTTSA